MNVNNSISTNETNFKSRLYLKNINKKDLELFKGISKDFHKATKDIKGASFSLKDTGDKFELISNQYKDNLNFAKIKKDGSISQNRSSFVDSCVTAARTIRHIETLFPPVTTASADTYSLTATISKLKALNGWLEEFSKKG